MKTILFYWSKGATIRREIIRIISECERKDKPCFLNFLAKELRLSHVAAKKHLDILIEYGFVKIINPKGKPHYLKLTKKGQGVIKEFIS